MELFAADVAVTGEGAGDETGVGVPGTRMKTLAEVAVVAFGDEAASVAFGASGAGAVKIFESVPLG
jgi:hypothetical protein